MYAQLVLAVDLTERYNAEPDDMLFPTVRKGHVRVRREVFSHRLSAK